MPTPLARFRPDAQIAFAERLARIEHVHLGAALGDAVRHADIQRLDAELSSFVPNERLARLAGFGLRGEAFFPCPLLLTAKPQLLGYYRLLFGISQKEFYRSLQRFKSMETSGTVTPAAAAGLQALCADLCETAWELLEGLSDVSLSRIRDLQLLTYGPQLRGGRLNEIGQAATLKVFNRIRAAIPDASVVEETAVRIVLTNSAGRRVTVAFSSDPDIAISEVSGTSVINKVAIEIKGGTDVSNIHNRLGEAEKSHQKAKAKGFPEFWTIISASVDRTVAARETPTTNRFYYLEKITDPGDREWEQFRDELAVRLGLADS
jgi:hypothetical protein